MSHRVHIGYFLLKETYVFYAPTVVQKENVCVHHIVIIVHIGSARLIEFSIISR